MNKLNKYNQIVFSALGSILLIVVIFSTITFITDEFFNRRISYPDDSLLVEEELDSLNQLELRSQIISLEGIKTFDTATNTYLIPVFQKNLTEAASNKKEVFALLDTRLSGEPYSYYEFGNYNNILLYNFDKDDSFILLKDRMNINQFETYNSTYIVITGWKVDTNKDGKLNDLDFKSVYIYNHLKSSIKEVKNDYYYILNSYFLKRVDQLVFKATDLRDSTAIWEERPEFLIRYNPSTNIFDPLVDPAIMNQLQEIIDN